MLPPPEQRQTVLFSATYPSDIKALCKSALRPAYEVVDTVGESDVQTAERVRAPTSEAWRTVCYRSPQPVVLAPEQCLKFRAFFGFTFLCRVSTTHRRVETLFCC